MSDLHAGDNLSSFEFGGNVWAVGDRIRSGVIQKIGIIEMPAVSEIPATDGLPATPAAPAHLSAVIECDAGTIYIHEDAITRPQLIES